MKENSRETTHACLHGARLIGPQLVEFSMIIYIPCENKQLCQDIKQHTATGLQEPSRIPKEWAAVLNQGKTNAITKPSTKLTTYKQAVGC